MAAAGCGTVATVTTGGLCPVASSLVGAGAGAVAGGVVQSIANSFAGAADRGVAYLVAAWTAIPTPSVSGGSASWLQDQLKPLVIFIGALAIIAAMVRMIWANRSEPAREALAGLLRLVVVSGAGLAGIDILLQAGDQFSNAILNAAIPGGGNFGHLAVLSGVATSDGGGLLLILALVAILASLIQIFLLVARAGLVVVLGGTWPLAAAASSTPAGNAWFKKTTAWLLAFIAFKPVAAIIYAAALRMTLDGSASGLATVEGVMLFVMAIIALPALMRFAVPAVAAVGGISAGKVAAGAAVLATGAIATGGALGSTLAQGGAGGGPSGSAPPANPTGAGPAPTGGPGAQPPSAPGAVPTPPPSPPGPAPGGAAAPAGAPQPTAAGAASGVAAAAGSAADAAARGVTSTTGEDPA